MFQHLFGILSDLIDEHRNETRLEHSLIKFHQASRPETVLCLFILHTFSICSNETSVLMRQRNSTMIYGFFL